MRTITNFLFVGLGGAIGGGLRHGLSLIPGANYLAAILVINIVGAALLPIIAQYLLPKYGASLQTRLLITTGVISSFTTFSAITGAMVEYVQHGQPWRAGTYLALILVVGLLAAAVGNRFAQHRARGNADPQPPASS